MGKLRRDADRPADADVSAPRTRLPRLATTTRHRPAHAPRASRTTAPGRVLLAVGTTRLLVVKDHPIAALNSKVWLDDE